MPLYIIRNGSLQTFTELQAALKSLTAGDIFDVSDQTILDPVPIDHDNITLQNTGALIIVRVAPGVRFFTLAPGAVATVYNGGGDTNIYGNDVGNSFFGGEDRDRIYGGNGDELISGLGGDDLLFGGAGADTLIAGTGRDRLTGGAGDDRLISDAGMNRIWSGAGSDTLEIHVDADQNTIIFDFSATDTIEIVGHNNLNSMAELLSAGGRFYEANGNTYIRTGGAQIQFRDTALTDISDSQFVFVRETVVNDPPPDLPVGSTSIMVGDVEYKIREAEPDHQNFKFQDAEGNWFSPDYFVVVAGGQSNMVGSSKSGEFIMNSDVMAYDWLNDRIVSGNYSAIPATTREGASARNNLYFPMAVELTEAMERPVLVVNRAVSGSRIDTWLDTQIGNNWAVLTDDVGQALAHIGQDSADAFIWLQGESDYPVDTALYAAYIKELVAQVRGTAWASADLDILLGELSRESANYVQNIAYQELEVTNTDSNLGFVSSAGLSSDDRDGVHFNGPSLNEYGHRFAQELLDLRAGVTHGPNTAPTTTVTGTVAQLTVTEGQELRVNVADFFADAEGDNLYYYSFLDRRAVKLTFEDQDTNEIVLSPDFDAAGSYKVSVYANDYYLDSTRITFDLTVLEAKPSIDTYSSRDFDRYLSSYADFDNGMAALTRNKGIDILDQSGLSGTVELTLDSMHIRGGAAIVGTFSMAADVQRTYFYGQGNFTLNGNALDNYMVGGNGQTTFHGGAGLDRLYGGNGNDVLTGGAGNDQMFGGAGKDWMRGGKGSDRATGGSGNDTFVFAQGDETLQIQDYTIGDVIEMRSFNGVANFDELTAHADRIFQSSTRTVIEIGDDRLMLSAFDVNNLSADMFHFA